MAVFWGQRLACLLSSLNIFTYLMLVLCTNLYFLLTVGETVEIGNFNPKVATFWIDSGILSLSHCLCTRTSHLSCVNLAGGKGLERSVSTFALGKSQENKESGIQMFLLLCR